MDQQKLRSLVFEKTGIKIDTSDPVFAIVAMNEALLDEAVQRHLLVLEQSSKAILQQLHALTTQNGTGKAGAARLADDDIWETSSQAGRADKAADSLKQANAQAQREAGTVDTTDATDAPDAAHAAANVAPVAPPVAAPHTLAPAGGAAARSLSADLRLAWITSLFSAVLVLLGLATFGPKLPEVIKVPAGFSAQQEAQLRQAEKMQKILPRLDAKTRAAIEAELQKP